MADTTNQEVDRIISEKLASGEYSNKDELLLAALHSLQAEDEEVAAIEAGLADVRNGHTQPLSDVDSEIRSSFSFLQDE